MQVFLYLGSVLEGFYLTQTHTKLKNKLNICLMGT